MRAEAPESESSRMQQSTTNTTPTSCTPIVTLYSSTAVVTTRPTTMPLPHGRELRCPPASAGMENEVSRFFGEAGGCSELRLALKWGTAEG